jgi:D-alanine-D-alanine ligase
VLEVNTQPGMTPTSLVPEQAAHVGMAFADLVVWMVEDASCER